MLAIVYRPRLVERTGSLIFSYPISRKPVGRAKSDAEQIELEQLLLDKGLTLVPPETWAAVESHPINRQQIEGLKAKGALSIHVPDAEAPVGSTSDFSDLSAIQDIVSNCTDLDWLQRSLARDQRERVFSMISDRVQMLKEERIQKAQQSSSFI